jgi:hypothetical protein
MQVLTDILCSLLAALTAAAFAQFGVNLKAKDPDPKSQPEVHRTTQAKAKSAPKPYVEVARSAPQNPRIGHN